MTDEQSTGKPPKGMDELELSEPDFEEKPPILLVKSNDEKVEVSEFEKRMALKQMEEERVEREKADEEEANGFASKVLTVEELEALTPEQRYRRSETILSSHIRATNNFMQRVGAAFSFAMQDLEYKQADGHKHAVFSKEIVRDLFKRAFGKPMEDAGNAKA